MIESSSEVSISYSHDGREEIIQGIWEPKESERNAAWDMYVELVTRLPVAYVRPEEGSLHIGISALYRLFDATREILRKYGPSVARPRDVGQISFGLLSVRVLDVVLRPFLIKWYPLLKEYEETRERSDSPQEHERKWERYEELSQAMLEVRESLLQYANLLARASEVPLPTSDGSE
jgi:hypothetical protein